MSDRNRDVAYAAGIIDGEGCIYIQPHKRTGVFSVRVSMAMTSRAIPDWLQATFGGRVKVFRKATKRHSMVWGWSLNGYKAMPFLEEIGPHLMLKRPQAALAMRLLEMAKEGWTPEKKQRARTMWLSMKAMNRKGPEPDMTPPVEGSRLYALRVGEEFVSPQRDMFSDTGWQPLSGSFPGSIISAPSGLWTLDSSEYHNEEGVYSECSLAAILEPNGDVPAKYWLSAKACKGILRRAERRGKTLPPLLRQALDEVAKGTESGTHGTPTTSPKLMEPLAAAKGGVGATTPIGRHSLRPITQPEPTKKRKRPAR